MSYRQFCYCPLSLNMYCSKVPPNNILVYIMGASPWRVLAGDGAFPKNRYSKTGYSKCTCPHEGIKLVPSVCPCVCLSVCQLSHGWAVSATDLRFGRNIAFDDISDKFKGQGHRSKVKVAILKKRDFPTFSYGVTYVNCTEPFCHDIWRRDVTSWLSNKGYHYWHYIKKSLIDLNDIIFIYTQSPMVPATAMVKVALAGVNN